MPAESTMISTTVRASNELAARWSADAGADDFVLSSACLWPLLALLASAADGPARDELAAAIGRPVETAQAEAIELIETIDSAAAASAALALWLRPGSTIADRDWAARLPAGTLGTLTDQAHLDSWAAEHTRGLIDKFPLQLDAGDGFILAAALAVRTRWRNVFAPSRLTPTHGPWGGVSLESLTRATADLESVATLDGLTPATRAVVAGVDDVDVHLLLGPPDAAPDAVLGVGIAAIAGMVTAHPASELPVGTLALGLTVQEFHGTRDVLHLTVPPFDIRLSRDLCAVPERFGLRAAMDAGGDNFPRLGKHLFVAGGAQDVLATFSWEGFEAAAVTAFAMRASSVMIPPTSRARRIEMTFDRPFGFLAVHRPTGLILVAGWVARPQAIR